MDDAAEERWRAWMIAAQRGDRRAYESLLLELVPAMRAWVRARVGDAAEDVVQNALLALHRARHSYRGERAFGPWLRAVARNAAIDFLRERRRRLRRERSLGEIEEADHPCAPPGLAQPLTPSMQRALASLPRPQREALELLHLQGLSVAEAAVRAGTTPGALKLRAHRATRTLRTRLGEGEGR